MGRWGYTGACRVDKRAQGLAQRFGRMSGLRFQGFGVSGLETLDSKPPNLKFKALNSKP